MPDAPVSKPPTAAAPPPTGKPPALGALRKAAGRGSDEAPVDAPPSAAADVPPATAKESPAVVTFELDDVIVAWAGVLDALPRSLRASIQEAQPVAVDGNVIVFGVARSHIDTVRPKFQRNADAIREAFIARLGGSAAVQVHPPRVGRRARVPRTGCARSRIPNRSPRSRTSRSTCRRWPSSMTRRRAPARR